jgi:hypothetical protein
MDNREARATFDALEWQLICALVAGWVMVAVRVVGVAFLLAGFGDRSVNVSPLLAESIACGALMTRFQQRHLYAPIILLGIWSLGFWTAWSGEDAPPILFSLGSLAIGAGLALGIYALMRLRTLGAPVVEPPAT